MATFAFNDVVLRGEIALMSKIILNSFMFEKRGFKHSRSNNNPIMSGVEE